VWKWVRFPPEALISIQRILHPQNQKSDKNKIMRIIEPSKKILTKSTTKEQVQKNIHTKRKALHIFSIFYFWV
jgi:hypothetical protein